MGLLSGNVVNHTILPRLTDPCCIKFSSHCDPLCVPLEDQEGVYHLVMKVNL